MFSSNKKKIRKFTEALSELMIDQNFSLGNALKILSRENLRKKKSDEITLCCKEILNKLENGESFANALKFSKEISFDNTYISFIRFSEKTGNLSEIISFLRERCKRQEENHNRIIESLLYPVFVIILAFIAVGFLLLYGKNIFVGEQIEAFCTSNLISSCGNAVFFLCVFCFCGGWVIKKNLGSDKLYEAFLAADFLLKNGESFGSAIETSAEILGKESPEGQLFLNARERLEYGVELKNAFICSNSRKWDEIQNMFYFAENAGNETQIFEKIASKLKMDLDKKRKFCLKLIEPMFIAGTGGFLLIFLMNTALPLLSGELFSF